MVGEFLGIDGDKNIWEYFSLNWLHLFPGLGHRTTFVKQAGNLNYWVERLQKHLASKLLGFSDSIHITDGFPVPVCNFKRAHFSKVFKEQANYGFCAAKNKTYYGFKGHLVINSMGVISHFAYAAANVDERDVVIENTEGIYGRLLGDKGLIRPELTKQLLKRNIILEHPLRDNMHDSRSKKYIISMKNKRRLVETVISQLSERFNIEKTRARNKWRISLRFMRKILSHTVGMYLNHLLGRPLLKLEGLVG